MYLITNRALLSGKDGKLHKGLDVFGKHPNPEGSNELRLMRVSRHRGGWSVQEVKDRLTAFQVKKLKDEFKLPIDEKEAWHRPCRSNTMPCR